jgi:hypothetical protein
MKNWILFLVLLAVAISGCTFDKYNRMVEHQNETLLKAFSEGLAKQNSEAGRLALTIAYVTRTGQQTLHAPETPATYLPMLNATILPWVALFHHGKDETNTNQSYEAGRDLIFQSTIDDNSHSGNDLLSRITGDYNTNTQYVCPNCPDGVEGEAGITGGGADSCNANPPAGYQNGKPLFSPGCSCKSHFIDNKC